METNIRNNIFSWIKRIFFNGFIAIIYSILKAKRFLIEINKNKNEINKQQNFSIGFPLLNENLINIYLLISKIEKNCNK